MLNPVFTPFINHSPISIMARGRWNRLFSSCREKSSTRFYLENESNCLMATVLKKAIIGSRSSEALLRGLFRENHWLCMIPGCTCLQMCSFAKTGMRKSAGFVSFSVFLLFNHCPELGLQEIFRINRIILILINSINS